MWLPLDGAREWKSKTSLRLRLGDLETLELESTGDDWRLNHWRLDSRDAPRDVGGLRQAEERS